MAAPVVADHAARARAAAGLRDPGPAGRRQGRPARARGGRAQRGDDLADDRAVLGARAPRSSSCSAGPTRRPTSSGAGPSRVRDIGVRSAMAMEVFFRALTLVSGLAQALIYGLGGYLALQGDLDPGTVVTMALLLNRLYAPLTALATARLDVVTALVSFERVFEVLDIEPLIAERADADAAARRARSRSSSTTCASRYPSADQVSLASLEEVAVLDDRGRRGGAARRVLARRARPDGGARGPVGRGQVDARLAGAPALRRRRAARCASAGVDVRDLSFDSIRGDRRRGHPGRPPLPRHHRRQPALRRARRHRRRAVGRRCASARLDDAGRGRCPTGSTPSSASGATACRAASASG